MSKPFTEPARELSSIGSWDVIVAGGGFAGVSAALAAARSGASVCLVEKNCTLGGLGTLGLVADYLPLCDGKGTQLIGGIGEELMLGVSRYDGSAPPAGWRKDSSEVPGQDGRYMLTYNPAAMELYLEEALLRERVTLLYDTRFCAVVHEGDRLAGLIVENKSGRCVIEGKMLVDATGDADVCAASGEAVTESDQNVCAWWFYSSADGSNTLNRRSDAFWPVPEGTRTYRGSDWHDVSALLTDSRSRIRRYLAGKSGAVQPLLIPHIPQFRMTRRIVGRETVHIQDDGRWLESAVGICGDWRRAGPRFCVPFGALCPERTANLLAAGRCISSDKAAWDVLRVIPVCALTGEAAGTAAAMAAKESCSTRALNVHSLQEQLKKRGVILDEALMKKDAAVQNELPRQG